ncbi:MAG: sugar ABC transporter ATP-binding protein [Anaerolineae bacterium]|nr:sugar ABC transporter ATP-binding protein [Anaerolineae bacterium]
MTSTLTPLIELKAIKKGFPGVQALDGVSLSVYPGEIHAIIGENGAGKSTLMNILAGELQPDSGDIIFQGRPVRIPHPNVSQQLGISVVYQELALCPNLSVAENISLNTARSAFGLNFVNRRQFAANARRVLSQLGMDSLELRQPVGRLTVAQQQMVEIGKAISTEVKALILDEPNSALTQEETDHLFAVLRDLRAAGVAIIYISHRLEEVLQLADRITVLRDGQWVDTLPAQEATVEGLIARMVGREVDSLFRAQGSPNVRAQVSFAVNQLSSAGLVRDLSFQVHAGEIVGVAGLPGAGKDELVECCFGLRPYSGEIEVQGQPVRLTEPEQAIKHGLALIPADRRGAGAMLVLSVQENIVAANLGQVSRDGLLQRPAMRALGQQYAEQLDIRLAGLTQKMGTLSGGNQQKVILARGLATNPAVLILHEPTRGIDVGAKAEIYTILQALAAGGVAILIVSSELPELIGQCDRILVMYQGRLTGHFDRAEAAEEPILACAMGQSLHLK